MQNLLMLKWRVSIIYENQKITSFTTFKNTNWKSQTITVYRLSFIVFKYYFNTCIGGGIMILDEYISNLEIINKEVLELRRNTNECESYIDQLMNIYTDKLEIKELATGEYKSLNIDKDLFINLLEHQIDKNDTRIFELGQELMKLKDNKVEL